eukprot:gene20580-27377_t
MAGVFHPPQPIPGLPIKPPAAGIQPGQVIVAYEMVEPVSGCCKCEDMSTTGIISIIIIVLIFPPLACIPCCMKSCFVKSQRPVYGFPPAGAVIASPQVGCVTGGYVPVAQPYGPGAVHYQPPAPAYTSGPTGYGAPPAGYGAPPQGYGAPPHGNGAPAPGYAQGVPAEQSRYPPVAPPPTGSLAMGGFQSEMEPHQK